MRVMHEILDYSREHVKRVVLFRAIMYFKLSNNIHKEVPPTLVILILLLFRPTVLHGIEVNGLMDSYIVV